MATRPVTESAARAQSARILRALVYAAKADGHIDASEEASIREQVGRLGLGEEGQELIGQMIAEQPDPAEVAKGVTDAEEALELFTISAAVSNPDTFMEKAYIDGLAKALSIPDDVRNELMIKLHPVAV